MSLRPWRKAIVHVLNEAQFLHLSQFVNVHVSLFFFSSVVIIDIDIEN